ncbi:MAG: hypothetical protein HKN47_03295, partial [Pirellulaceae bacterium]|nr:hypothetical protein [Pirellulaceae bacterium]
MTTHQDVLERDTTTAPRMNWIVRLLFVLSAGGGIWYFYRTGDYVGVAFVWVTLVASFSGFRMGLTRMGASVVALGAAICVAPQLGISQEARFAQWLGTTGLINRFVSIAVVGLVIAFVLTLILSAISTRMM